MPALLVWQLVGPPWSRAPSGGRRSLLPAIVPSTGTKTGAHVARAVHSATRRQLTPTRAQPVWTVLNRIYSQSGRHLPMSQHAPVLLHPSLRDPPLQHHCALVARSPTPTHRRLTGLTALAGGGIMAVSWGDGGSGSQVGGWRCLLAGPRPSPALLPGGRPVVAAFRFINGLLNFSILGNGLF